MKFKAGEAKDFSSEFVMDDYNLVQFVGMEDKSFGGPTTTKVLRFKIVVDSETLGRLPFDMTPLTKSKEVKTSLLNEFYEALGKVPVPEGEDFDVPEDPTVDSGFLKPVLMFIERQPNTDYGRIPAFRRGGKVFLPAGADTEAQSIPSKPSRDDDEKF